MADDKQIANKLTASQEDKQARNDVPPPVLTEDTEIIGPGRLLADARKAMGLSQQEVARQLNFRVALVEQIEQDSFDRSVPATFNRGYLRNYARLVGVSEQDVLSSYKMLGVAEQQGAEMQSFSKITKKQAEHSRLKWFSYFIVLLLVASTVIWFIQESQAVKISANANTNTETNDNPANITEQPLTAGIDINQLKASNVNTDKISVPDSNNTNRAHPNTITKPLSVESLPVSEATEPSNPQQAVKSTATSVTEDVLGNNSLDNSTLNNGMVNKSVELVFRFAGDCWVNIYDANGERLAWGIKKSGYVMTIAGQAPFKVTLGKPELVELDYAGEPQDMSQFSVGHIAKFTLPFSS